MNLKTKLAVVGATAVVIAASATGAASAQTPKGDGEYEKILDAAQCAGGNPSQCLGFLSDYFDTDSDRLE